MQPKRYSRLQKELDDLKTYKDLFVPEVDANNFLLWKVSFKGAENSLYANEKFTLEFKFPNEYVIIFI